MFLFDDLIESLDCDYQAIAYDFLLFLKRLQDIQKQSIQAEKQRFINNQVKKCHKIKVSFREE